MLVLTNDVKPLGHSTRGRPLLNREAIKVFIIISMTDDDSIANAWKTSTYL